MASCCHQPVATVLLKLDAPGGNWQIVSAAEANAACHPEVVGAFGLQKP